MSRLRDALKKIDLYTITLNNIFWGTGIWFDLIGLSKRGEGWPKRLRQADWPWTWLRSVSLYWTASSGRHSMSSRQKHSYLRNCIALNQSGTSQCIGYSGMLEACSCMGLFITILCISFLDLDGTTVAKKIMLLKITNRTLLTLLNYWSDTLIKKTVSKAIMVVFINFYIIY